MPRKSRSKHATAELRFMIPWILKERRIALPGIRFVWYARWLGVTKASSTVYNALAELVKEGELICYQEGQFKFYKLNIRRNKSDPTKTENITE